MAEEQEPTRQYHTPALPPTDSQKWCLWLYPKKAGPPLRITCATKRECYEHFDSLGPANVAPFSTWEITHQAV